MAFFFSSNNKYKSISKEDTPCAEKQVTQRRGCLLFPHNNILHNKTNTIEDKPLKCSELLDHLH